MYGDACGDAVYELGVHGEDVVIVDLHGVLNMSDDFLRLI